MFSCKNYLFAKAQITFLLKGTILSSNAELLQAGISCDESSLPLDMEGLSSQAFPLPAALPEFC